MDFDQILPQLFIGCCPLEPADIDLLKAILPHGGSQLTDGGRFRLLGYRLAEVGTSVSQAWYRTSSGSGEDFNRKDLRQRLPVCVQALDELLRSGHTVYVHCSGGVNRSPSTVVAYLHWNQGMAFDEAVNYVQERRDCAPVCRSDPAGNGGSDYGKVMGV